MPLFRVAMFVLRKLCGKILNYSEQMKSFVQKPPISVRSVRRAFHISRNLF